MIIKGKRIAVLGAGIMGCSLALLLARRGANVDLIDRESSAMACASRWNEGKIHLGYIYGADPSLRSARHMMTGGLLFGPKLEELVGSSISAQITQSDDTMLVHKLSIASAAELSLVYDAISRDLRDHPDARSYLNDVTKAHARPLTTEQIAEIANTDEIVAGFRIPERSINTQWVADQINAALSAETRISFRSGTIIKSARPIDQHSGKWRVSGEPDLNQTYDLVINALWNGRLAIDASAGLPAAHSWSNRYRLSVFARTTRTLAVRSAIVAVGAFGDVKNYDGRDFYLSWYPAGLISDTADIAPEIPALSAADKQDVLARVQRKLSVIMPPVAAIFDHAESLRVEGGFVFAQGHGLISDPKATLHRRDKFGIKRFGNYFSVDTGKYSTAPWLASELVDSLDREI